MSANSNSQQRFMGTIDAYKKSKVSNPSAQVKKADDATAPVNNFAYATRNQLSNQVDESALRLETIAKYRTFGKALKRQQSMREIAEQLAQIAEMAEQAVVAEADDWFDAHTLKRNMKEIKSYTGDFSKLAQESDMLEQRMTALYDDMGRILDRYFELPDDLDPSNNPGAGSDNTVAATAPSHNKVPMKQNEEFELHNPSEPALPNNDGTQSPVKNKTDKLTLLAIKAVHDRLKKKNPAFALKFSQLPPQEMETLVWKLVK